MMTTQIARMTGTKTTTTAQLLLTQAANLRYALNLAATHATCLVVNAVHRTA
jgi:hypothetical protein